MTTPRTNADGGEDRAPRLPSRREFAARAGTALAALSTLGASTIATACAGGGRTAAVTTPPVARTSPDPAAKDSAAAAAAATTRRADPMTEALFAAVEARYGARLEPEQRPLVRDAIARSVRLSDTLRKRGVPNSVDPFSSFVAPAAGAVTRGGGGGSGGGSGGGARQRRGA